MASTNQESPAPQETEPLLGRPGDASQGEGKGLQYNFFIGTGTVAQAGIWILAALVWSAIFMNDLVPLFSPHPLLNSAGILLLTQGILVLQPTYTKEQKTAGTNVHFALNLLGFLSLISGLIIIEINKGDHQRFTSVHGIMGLVTYILLLLQTLVGFAQYFLPSIFGGVDKAKAIYKYHRISGYIILTFALATICAATQTTFNKNVLHIQLWAVIVASVLVLLGLLPRIKKAKLGF